MAKSDDSRGSMLLVDEYFGGQDPRFIDELRRVKNAKQLAAFVDRWKRDPRPWAREQMLAYARLPFDVVGHHPVVKRLFKHAESVRDDELVATFLVAFDRLIRRKRKTRHHYDWQTRQSWQEEVLSPPRDVLPAEDGRSYRNPRTGEEIAYPSSIPRSGTLFRYRTRQYLRRRAWRYFRRLGFQRPQDYPAAIARALQLYRDEDLSKGEHVLECWGLLEACYRHHPALSFGARRIALQEGRSLGELTPAPRFLSLWQRQQPNDSLPILLGLVTGARARLVRLWAMDLIRREHGQRLGEIDIGQLIAMLEHVDAEVQQFAVELLNQSPNLSTLSVDSWLRLLTVKDPTAQAAICDLIKKHVARERLTLRQCVDLACAQAAPIARLGFTFVKESSPSTAEDRQTIGRLAGTKCAAVGTEIAQWALSIVGTREHYDRDAVLAFLDSLLMEVREGAWQWLVSGSPAAADATLFSRLLESPYDDIRLRLIDELQNKAKLPAMSASDLAPIWSTVLLGVHRGGRQKIKATGQLADAIVARPDRAAELVPVLAVAVRSIRPTEWRAGLSSLVKLVEHRPDLAALVGQQLPEMKMLEPPTWN